MLTIYKHTTHIYKEYIFLEKFVFYVGEIYHIADFYCLFLFVLLSSSDPGLNFSTSVFFDITITFASGLLLQFSPNILSSSEFSEGL